MTPKQREAYMTLLHINQCEFEHAGTSVAARRAKHKCIYGD